MTALPARIDAPASERTGIASRLARQDWHGIEEQLNAFGCARLPSLLEEPECDDLEALYPQEERFRSRIVMARHGFGLGEYKYFCYPLPPMVSELRQAAYGHLAPMANRWQEALRVAVRYPVEHAHFIRRCHEAGQNRPTPLMLRYTTGDYNCLHQDLYGEHVFPLQLAILLDRPGQDFTGGEFVMTEQRPRRQSRPEVVPLDKGDAVVFAVHTRPAAGSRGMYRVNHRHGVSRLRSGSRHTLGVIFHDAQ
jgi:hypothetical protein